MRIAGSVALVTGANRGIGAAIVAELARRGAAKVYAAARNPSGLPAAATANVVPLRLDVTRTDHWQEAAARAPDLTLLVNNAGISHFGLTLGNEAALEILREELEVNLFGILHSARAFGEILGKNGGGAIVNILSAAALMNVPLLATYSVSKAAALSLTQGLRATFAAQKTLVTAVIAGSVDTRMAKDVPAGVMKASPASIAAAMCDGVERNDEDIDSDPMAVDIRARLARDPKKLERFYSRGLQAALPR